MYAGRSAWLLFSVLLTGCTYCGQKHPEAVPDEHKILNEKTIRLSFYSCSYTAGEYNILLQSADKENPEIWAVDKADINRLPVYSVATFNSSALIKVAEEYIFKKYAFTKAELTDMQVKRINKKDNSGERNWFVELTFQCGEHDYRIVPVLLDGRVVLSNREIGIEK